MKANYNMEEDLKKVIAESRKLALSYKHDFIQFHHLFLAMLKTNCLVNDHLGHVDVAYWADTIKTAWPNNGTKTTRDNLPLTLDAERIIKHAYKIAEYINAGDEINTVHLMLAILSFDNEITRAFSKAGIVIEDITGFYFGKMIKKFPPALKPMRVKKYSKLELFLLLPGLKNKKLAAIERGVINLYNYGQLNDAINVCNMGISVSPSTKRFKTLLRTIYLKQLDFEQSLILTLQLMDEDPDDKSLKFSLSYIYTMLKNYNESEKILDELLSAEPDQDSYLNNKGSNLSQQEKYLASIPFFERSVQNNPLCASAWNNLGFAKYKTGQTQQGIQDIDASLLLNKGNPFAYYNKGIIYMEQGNNELAKQNLKLALKFGFPEKYGDDAEQLLAKIG